MKQLSPTDAMFVYNESAHAPLHISPLMIYRPPAKGQPPVRFKDILKRINARIYKSPVLRRKLSRFPLDLDRPYWVDDKEFDIEFHVRHIALPKPGDWRQFCIQIARLHSKPVDLTRPPWEAYVIEGLDNINGLPKGCFALYIKIHHSAIDGNAGNRIVEALHDLTPDVEDKSEELAWSPEDEPTFLSKLGRAYMGMFRSSETVKNLIRHVKNSRRFSSKDLIGDEEIDHGIKGRSRFNQQVSAHRVFGGLRIQLSDLKAIKNAVDNCTLNDVLLSVVAGTMRHYLREKGELPEETLVVGVPISIRVAGGDNPEEGNEVAGMRINLRTDVADPLDRLRLINEDAVSSKAYANAIGAERMITVINSIPSGIASLGVRAMVTTGLNSRAPVAHTIVTNVPGIQQPLYFCGAEALLFIGIGCPIDGMGLFHTIQSYNGYAFLSFICCRKMMPDPELYHRCINISLEEHLKAVGELPDKRGRSQTGRSRSRTRSQRSSRQTT